MLTATDALERLREGNRRFASGRGSGVLEHPLRRDELLGGQRPFAAVLGCSDSRVPVELVFDQGLGSLFVIRVAGNVVGSTQIGSVEFAVEQLGTRLVVVLGHTRCGAVAAALDDLRRPAKDRPRGLRAIVDRIRPSLEGLSAAEEAPDAEALAREAVRANVRAAARGLREGSEVLEARIRSGELLVVGAEYALETGAVEFFDGAPG